MKEKRLAVAGRYSYIQFALGPLFEDRENDESVHEVFSQSAIPTPSSFEFFF